MAQVTIETSTLDLQVVLTPRQDFMSCLIPALLTALPSFIEAYLKCLASGGTGGNYNPGGPDRCLT